MITIIANNEGPAQSDLGLHCLFGGHFWSVAIARNFIEVTVLKILPAFHAFLMNQGCHGQGKSSGK